METFLGGKFEEDSGNWREISFTSSGLQYRIVVIEGSGQVNLRIDPETTAQSCPAVEIDCHCNRIRVTDGGRGGKALIFALRDNAEAETFESKEYRLVIDRLSNGNLYV